MPIHSPYIHRCLELAQQAAGQTAPNPMVGSVIVKDGTIIGEGFHPKAGEPHAEVFALRAAGDQAKGATLYVNLEPCNHTGRTPPCTEAILKAEIDTVVVGMADPNLAASGGIERLQAAGITVIVGIEEAACRQLNEAFIHRIRHHRPFGILKYAMTLDGKIATDTGHSAWVTSPESRRRVHQLRGICDAVIVGGNTVRRDNPNLTTHGVALQLPGGRLSGGKLSGADNAEHSEPARNPLRVVMSRQLDLPRQAHLWDTKVAPTVVFTENTSGDGQTRTHSSGLARAHLENQGVEVIDLPTLTPDAVMENLYGRRLLSVLWECGGTLAAAAIAQGSVQKVWAFIAPKMIGGSQALTPVGDLGLTQMTQALPIQQPTIETIGADWLIQGYLEKTL